MKPLSERIKDFPADQFIDWLCLACVDVREVRTPDDAQEEIDKIREAVTERLAALKHRAEAAEAKLAEMEKQEPVLYALRFKNSRGEPEQLINENCLFRDREKAAAYGLGGNFVTQQSGKIAWVPNPSLNPEVIPLFTRPAPAMNLAELVPEWTNEQCLEFLSIAFRHAEISGDIEMDDIRLAVKMVNAKAPEVE